VAWLPRSLPENHPTLLGFMILISDAHREFYGGSHEIAAGYNNKSGKSP
jgi:hypothetical protein